MKVLHLHQTDALARTGGGVIAMYRLHFGLKKAKVDSMIMTGVKRPEFPDSRQIPQSPGVRKLESLLGRFARPLGFNDIHCVSSFGIAKTDLYQQADVLDFHGMQGGYFSYLALPSLTADKPGVLTLHDMWPFTGHCAYSYDCERWRTGCGKCPYLTVSPPVQRDSTRLEWKLKKWIYGRSNLSVVALSKCRTEQVQQSMLNRFPIHHIPNGIDLETFRPLDRGFCRRALDIPEGKKVLLFTAAKLNQFNKGGDLLVKAIAGLPDSIKQETILLVLGDGGETIADSVDIPTINLGYVTGDKFKVMAYCAADIFVFPTRAESLPLVVQESMACGTPTVSFRVGGVPDLVRPGETGCLAEPENVRQFRDGILELLEDDALRAAMGQKCRAVAVDEYSVELQVQRYIELYKSVIRN